MNGSIGVTLYGGCQRARHLLPDTSDGLIFREYYGDSDRGQIVVMLSKSRTMNQKTQKSYDVTYVLTSDGAGWFFYSEVELL